MKLFFFEFWFQIWITPKHYIIGRLSVAVATVKKFRLHDSMRNFEMYLPSKYDHNSTYGYWVRMTPVFSQSDALYGYHVNQMKIIHWFWKSVTRATIWYILHTCNILRKLCNLIRKEKIEKCWRQNVSLPDTLNYVEQIALSPFSIIPMSTHACWPSYKLLISLIRSSQFTHDQLCLCLTQY